MWAKMFHLLHSANGQVHGAYAVPSVFSIEYVWLSLLFRTHINQIIEPQHVISKNVDFWQV